MHAYDINRFLNGAIFMGDVAIALLFLRCWSRTGDRLFAWFAVSFGLLAIERVFMFIMLGGDGQPAVFITRLFAFGFIIFAVVDRNRRPS
jgi:hypothetical protein